MVIFEKIRWKNFLSTGNIFTEIELNAHTNSLIIGENGAGKSTILDALCFVLFGKPFRNINKPQLINSINAKNLVTEIEFSIGAKSYKVIRGIKPAIFEIWCNGVCLNQDSASKDYQEYLEKHILQMTYKSFTQIVILGSASFKPFMQLTPAERRIIIEDLLDIQIFSVMNTLAKQRLLNNREALESNKIKGLGKTEKIQFVQTTINSLKRNNDEKVTELKNKQTEYQNKLDVIVESLTELRRSEVELKQKISPLSELRSKLNKASSLSAKLNVKLNTCTKSLQFFKENENCPTCKQEMQGDSIINEVATLTKQQNELTTAKNELSKRISAIEENIKELEDIHNKLSDIWLEIASKEEQEKNLRLQLNDIENTINNAGLSDKVLHDSETELQQLKNDIAKNEQEKERLLAEKMLIETTIQLLKDGGIKSKIIKKYLPVINKLINSYLSQMGFFVNFEIDENFNETIKSRHRDSFSYQNFSEGEKTRIDLAILFAWRAIAKMRNSINTNLLIFDEIFDGSLDVNGTDEFLKIIWNLTEDINVFVISHKQDQLIDKFKKIYKFSKKRGFSGVTV